MIAERAAPPTLDRPQRLAPPRQLRGSPPGPPPPRPVALAGPERRPDWGELIAREPRLIALRAEALAVADTDPRGFCRNSAWLGLRRDGPPDPQSLRRRLGRLVGRDYSGDDPVLGTPGAYGTAFRRIFFALPRCRNCHCRAEEGDE